MKQPLKILLLEDSTIDAEIIQRLLVKQEMECSFELAMNKKSFLSALQEFSPDVILSDNSIAGFSAADALKITRLQFPHIPFILVTGTVSEEFAANIIKEGADDYILKDRMARLPAAIEVSIKQRRIEEEKEDALEKLTQSEGKYRTIFMKSPLSKWVFDPETLRFLDVNDAAIREYGYTREEFLNMTIKDIRPDEDVPVLLHEIEKISHSEDTRQGNWRHRKKNGEIVFVEITAHSIDYHNRKARMVISRDITERLRAEAALRLSEMRLNEAQAITHISNWEIDLVNDVHTWSAEVYNIYGLPANTIPSLHLFLHFIHPDDKKIAEEMIHNALRNYTASKIDFRFFTHNNLKRYGHIEWKFDFDNDGKATRLFGILQDITERRQAEENLKLLEQKILEQKIQAQKKIARAIIKAQEQQRNHIAQELHDNINQILAGTKLYLGIAGNKDKETKELVRYPMELIDSSIDQIRLLCHKLVTPLKNIDLQELVTDLLHKLGGHPATHFNFSVQDELSDDLKLNIYRIIQEQVNNILKHACANKINVGITTNEKTIYISVEDDGKGFDMEAKRNGIGISNMLNRVDTFNGKVEIQSSPGMGCAINIAIPF